MIVVVPHTHWDREWYLPFQRFRLQLVALLDGLIDQMEADPRLRFTLDGQMAAVDDYLEVRPERRGAIAALVRQGRLAVGPWQILHDEFLCSGENIIRNLELGLRRAEELGSAMKVGYLPDQFGHCAQTPQILRQAGIEHACVYRGVPEQVRTHAFSWVAPDGTAIRTEYLPEGGYGNAAGMFNDGGQVARRTADFEARMGAWRPGGGPLLAMYGADHAAPTADLADQVAAAGLKLDTLAGYLAGEDSSTAGLMEVHGELRSHARANILPGVISARIHLKQAMSRAERMVERYAEPLAALWLTEWPGRFLDMAWTRLIEVSCHDSVTGCGSDDTAGQVAARMAEAEQLGQAVRDMVTAELAENVPGDAHLLVNPTPARRTGLVTLDVPSNVSALRTADGRLLPVQILEAAPTVLDDAVHPAADLPVLLRRVHERELYGQEITEWSVRDRTLTFHVAPRSDTPFDIAEVREALQEADGEWRVRILADPRQTVAALVEVPPLGHTSARPADGAAELIERPVRAEGSVLDNGILRIDALTDAGRLVDGGDLGDTYNYAPPHHDRLIDTPLSVRSATVWSGPLVAAIDVVRTYAWPRTGDFPGDARSEATEVVAVTTRVELRSGEPFVRLRFSFDNRCEDHRLRWHLPLPSPAPGSFAEGQFAVVERGLSAEGGGGEVPIPTFPASAFVAAGGRTVLLEHVSEYEVTGGELAVTLLRSVGYLSRNHHIYRDEPAGPQVPTPLAQCRGDRTVSLAFMPYVGGLPGPAVAEAAERFRHEMLAIPGSGPAGAPLPPPQEGLEVIGEGVALTSLREHGGRSEARLVSQRPDATTAVINGTRLPMRPWEIATVLVSGGRR